MEPTSAPDPRWPAPSVAPPPSPVPTPAASRRTPTHPQPRLWIGLVVLGLGFGLFVAGSMGLALSPAPDDYPAMAVPGARSLTLDEGTGYTLYLEWAGTEPSGSTPTVRVTGPTGDEEPLLDADALALDYTTLDGREGRPFASLRPTVTGVYRFQTELGADERADGGLLVTVGNDEGETASWVAFFMAGFGLVALAAGVILLIVRAVRRRRTRPQASAPQASGAGRPEPGC